MATYHQLGDRRIKVPDALVAEGGDRYRDYLLEQACPRDDEGEPIAEGWLLPFDPREYTVSEVNEMLDAVGDPEITGFIRAADRRKTVRQPS